ncbi:hypothetical protein P691DRAFT_761403 [Macrolepiota fuliginosa MF-IS2]|uniref:Uncharacterized protein n=1 Tax=Macrolepiota fuliginosa MF-IS2 TaxID=1400762 RepID=A0A9P5XCC2_9AGAR|nr:hypothetical protein P691DRAFT_761403 [Macrolepiota fuliginosa MF-IS2]
MVCPRTRLNSILRPLLLKVLHLAVVLQALARALVVQTFATIAARNATVPVGITLVATAAASSVNLAAATTIKPPPLLRRKLVTRGFFHASSTLAASYIL